MPLLRTLLASVALLLALAGRPAHAAHSYDSCTGYISSLPAYVSQQGTWCLNKDLTTAITSGYAITIGANNVTIDCNGFKVGGLAAGPTTTAWGIYASGRYNSTIRNCGVRGFSVGIFLWDGGGHLVEDNRLDQNLSMGIGVRYGATTDNLVRRNRVYDTGGSPYSNTGIYARGDILENTVVGLFATTLGAGVTGIAADGAGTEVRGNHVRELTLPAGGSAAGIVVNATRIAVIQNRVATEPALVGYGIDGHETDNTFCVGNTVSGFSSGGVINCRNSSGGNDWW